jgi:hypothetical protein
MAEAEAEAEAEAVVEGVEGGAAPEAMRRGAEAEAAEEEEVMTGGSWEVLE